jgi:hypothetical protein
MLTVLKVKQKIEATPGRVFEFPRFAMASFSNVRPRVKSFEKLCFFFIDQIFDILWILRNLFKKTYLYLYLETRNKTTSFVLLYTWEHGKNELFYLFMVCLAIKSAVQTI